MRVPIGYTLTGADPVTVTCGYQAQAAVERKYNAALGTLIAAGMKQEVWAYMAWTQAARDKLTDLSFTAFSEALEDLDLSKGEDPPGQAPGQSREPS